MTQTIDPKLNRIWTEEFLRDAQRTFIVILSLFSAFAAGHERDGVFYASGQIRTRKNQKSQEGDYFSGIQRLVLHPQELSTASQMHFSTGHVSFSKHKYKPPKKEEGKLR